MRVVSLWVDMVEGRVFIYFRWVWVENDDDNVKGYWNNVLLLLSLLCFVSKMQSQGGVRNGGCPTVGYRGVMGSGFFRGTLRICMGICLYTQGCRILF